MKLTLGGNAKQGPDSWHEAKFRSSADLSNAAKPVLIFRDEHYGQNTGKKI